MLVAAAGLAVLDRHLVVASRGPAPDDVLLGILVVAVVLMRLAHVPDPRRANVAIALTIATFAFVGIAFIVGTRYHVDSVVAPHRAAELLLDGRDPYRDFDLVEAAARFGLAPALVTHRIDGTAVSDYAYPALSFLVPAPFVAAGLTDVRWIYLGELLLLLAFAAHGLGAAARLTVVAVVVGNLVIGRQYVLAGVDPTWLVFTVVAWRTLGRRSSALAVGLAVAARQTAWFVAPLYFAAVARRHGAREAMLRCGVGAAAVLLVHAPFLLDAPGAVARDVLGPLAAPLEPDGVGLVRLGLAGATPLLPQAAYGALAALAAVGATALALRRGRLAGGAGLGLAPLYLAWRSLQSYLAFAPLLALLAPLDDLRSSEHARREVTP